MAILFGRSKLKVCFHGKVNDVNGEKMAKSNIHILVFKSSPNMCGVRQLFEGVVFSSAGI